MTSSAPQSSTTATNQPGSSPTTTSTSPSQFNKGYQRGGASYRGGRGGNASSAARTFNGDRRSGVPKHVIDAAENVLQRRMSADERHQFEIVKELKPTWDLRKLIGFLENCSFDGDKVQQHIDEEFEFSRPGHEAESEAWQTVPRKEKKVEPQKFTPAVNKPNGVAAAADGVKRDFPPRTAGSASPNANNASANRPTSGAAEKKKKEPKEEKKEYVPPVQGKSYASALAPKKEPTPSPTAAKSSAANANAQPAGASATTTAAPASTAAASKDANDAATTKTVNGSAHADEQKHAAPAALHGPALARMGHVGNMQNPAVAAAAAMQHTKAEQVAATAAAAPAPSSSPAAASSTSPSPSAGSDNKDAPAQPAASPTGGKVWRAKASPTSTSADKAASTTTATAAPTATTAASTSAPTTTAASTTASSTTTAASSSTPATTTAATAPSAAAQQTAASIVAPSPQKTASTTSGINTRVHELLQSEKPVLLPEHVAAAHNDAPVQFQFGSKGSGPRAPKPKESPTPATAATTAAASTNVAASAASPATATPQAVTVQPTPVQQQQPTTVPQSVGQFSAAQAAPIGTGAGRAFGGISTTHAGAAPIGSKPAGISHLDSALGQQGQQQSAAADNEIIAAGHPTTHPFSTTLHDDAQLGTAAQSDAQSHYVDNSQFNTFSHDVLGGANTAAASAVGGFDDYSQGQEAHDQYYGGYNQFGYRKQDQQRTQQPQQQRMQQGQAYQQQQPQQRAANVGALSKGPAVSQPTMGQPNRAVSAVGQQPPQQQRAPQPQQSQQAQQQQMQNRQMGPSPAYPQQQQPQPSYQQMQKPQQQQQPQGYGAPTGYQPMQQQAPQGYGAAKAPQQPQQQQPQQLGPSASPQFNKPTTAQQQPQQPQQQGYNQAGKQNYRNPQQQQQQQQQAPPQQQPYGQYPYGSYAYYNSNIAYPPYNAYPQYGYQTAPVYAQPQAFGAPNRFGSAQFGNYYPPYGDFQQTEDFSKQQSQQHMYSQPAVAPSAGVMGETGQPALLPPTNQPATAPYGDATAAGGWGADSLSAPKTAGAVKTTDAQNDLSSSRAMPSYSSNFAPTIAAQTPYTAFQHPQSSHIMQPQHSYTQDAQRYAPQQQQPYAQQQHGWGQQ